MLKTFRIMRIFKIIRSWKSLKKLLGTVFNSISSIGYLACLMLLLVFIYALIGMQFFNGPRPIYQGEEFRINFSNFYQSMISVFILLTGENWNLIMAVFIKKTNYVACIYFISLQIFGNIMLLNMFLAILLNFISEK